MRSSRDLTPTSAYHAWLRDFDLRDIDAADGRSMWALKYRSRLQAALAPLLSLPAGARVLEVGSSQANASLLAAERGLRTVALDRELQALSYARSKHLAGDFTTVCADAVALPFPADTFDAALLLELLEHLPAPSQALAEARRVLKPGGLLVVTTPNAARHGEQLPAYSARMSCQQASAAADGAGHLFAFTLNELRDLLRAAGFQPVLLRTEGSVLMSDRFALKRCLTVGATLALSRLFNRLPGAAAWAYGCLAVAKLPQAPQ